MRELEHRHLDDHQPLGCLLNRLFRHRSKKTSKLRVTGLREGNLPVAGDFPSQRASNQVTRKMFLFDDVIMAFIEKKSVFNWFYSDWVEFTLSQHRFGYLFVGCIFFSEHIQGKPFIESVNFGQPCDWKTYHHAHMEIGGQNITAARRIFMPPEHMSCRFFRSPTEFYR